MASAGGVQKVIQKLRTNIEAGNFYEAHEMFKTVYHRYRSRRQLESSYQLAEEGAKLQLEKGQLNCGIELAMLLIEAYETDGAPPSEASVQRVLSVMGSFPKAGPSDGYEPPVEDCTKLAGATLKWLRRSGGEEYIAAVELQLAQYIKQVLGWQGLGYALPHFAQAGDQRSLAAAVADAVAHGLAQEEDLFLARCVLQTATAGAPPQAEQQLKAASSLLGAYEEVTGHALPDTPLVRFVKLFLEALHRKSEQLTQLLLQHYRPSIDRDPTLWSLIIKARAAHIPAAPSSGGMGGLFGDLFKNLMAPPPPRPA